MVLQCSLPMWVDDDDIEEMVLDKDNDDGDEFEYEDL
jgi:hypothetical protein